MFKRIDLVDFSNKAENGKFLPMETGIIKLDKFFDGGLYAGEISGIVAGPGTGKSALCFNIGYKLAENGYRVLYCSNEMDNAAVCQRILSFETGYNQRNIRMGMVKPELAGKINNKMVYDRLFFDTESVSIQKTIESIDKFYKEGEEKQCVVVIDYLQNLDNENKFNTDLMKIDNTFGILKNYLKEKNIAVLLISDMSLSNLKEKKIENYNLSIFKGSSKIGYNCHNAYIVYKEDGNINIMCLKQRAGGSCGKILKGIIPKLDKMTFDFSFGHIENESGMEEAGSKEETKELWEKI